MKPDDPASETNRESRLWKGYSFLLDLQATASRLLFKSCSPFKVFQNKALQPHDNRRLRDFPTAQAERRDAGPVPPL
jgi:hypothetical protein